MLDLPKAESDSNSLSVELAWAVERLPTPALVFLVLPPSCCCLRRDRDGRRNGILGLVYRKIWTLLTTRLMRGLVAVTCFAAAAGFMRRSRRSAGVNAFPARRCRYGLSSSYSIRSESDGAALVQIRKVSESRRRYITQYWDTTDKHGARGYGTLFRYSVE